MSSPRSDPKDATGISIGRLARVTGVPADTLRSWERRYGCPRPQRLPSGHRRYPEVEVARLRLVVRLMGRGSRAADLLRLDEPTLRGLLDADSRLSVAVRACLAAAARLDAGALRRRLFAEVIALGAVPFASDVVVPLQEEVRERSAAAELGADQERLAASVTLEVLDELTGRVHAGLAPAGAPLLATQLGGEWPGASLPLLKLMAAVRAVPLRVFGQEGGATGDTGESVAGAARRQKAMAVLLHASEAGCRARSSQVLERLEGALGEGVPLLAFGASPPVKRRSAPGVHFGSDLRAFDAWLAARE